MILKIKKLDILFICLFLFISIMIIIYPFSGLAEKKLLIVSENQKIRLSFDDRSYDFNQLFIDYYENQQFIDKDIKLLVKDSSVEILSSSCRDKICINTSNVIDCGDRIVCLPNKFMVTIDCSSE